LGVSPEELAKLFETASERWAMMTSIADPGKLDEYTDALRLCKTLAISIRMASVDEAEFVGELAQLIEEMESLKFCTHCGRKLTFGIVCCPGCGKRIIE
jgi:NADH pyrophosphatase NudC (nudix superfamily)